MSLVPSLDPLFFRVSGGGSLQNVTDLIGHALKQVEPYAPKGVLRIDNRRTPFRSPSD